MNLETLRHFLLWCTVIDYGILLLWVGLTLFAFGWMQRLCSRWYGISAEHFSAINFAGIVFFKSAVILFNLVPLIAVHLAA
jgi:hypothetical protein